MSSLLSVIVHCYNILLQCVIINFTVIIIIITCYNNAGFAMFVFLPHAHVWFSTLKPKLSGNRMCFGNSENIEFHLNSVLASLVYIVMTTCIKMYIEIIFFLHEKMLPIYENNYNDQLSDFSNTNSHAYAHTST